MRYKQVFVLQLVDLAVFAEIYEARFWNHHFIFIELPVDFFLELFVTVTGLVGLCIFVFFFVVAFNRCYWLRLAFLTLASITLDVISKVARPSLTVILALSQDMVLKTVFELLEGCIPFLLSLLPLFIYFEFLFLFVNHILLATGFAEQVSSPHIPDQSLFCLLGEECVVDQAYRVFRFNFFKILFNFLAEG